MCPPRPRPELCPRKWPPLPILNGSQLSVASLGISLGSPLDVTGGIKPPPPDCSCRFQCPSSSTVSRRLGRWAGRGHRPGEAEPLARGHIPEPACFLCAVHGAAFQKVLSFKKLNKYYACDLRRKTRAYRKTKEKRIKTMQTFVPEITTGNV